MTETVLTTDGRWGDEEESGDRAENVGDEMMSPWIRSFCPRMDGELISNAVA